MSQHVETNLVLGAASPVGAALLHTLVSRGEKAGVIYAAEQLADLRFLRELRTVLGRDADRIQIITYEPNKKHLGFDDDVRKRLCETKTHIYHLAHTRDRSRAASEISAHNSGVCDGVLHMARQAENLGALVIGTDVGLAGDYRGVFSEHWVDVGQVSFDEVDRSSLETEIKCLEETELPIIRARLGLLSDPRHIPIRNPHWASAVATLLPSVGILKRLPLFLSIPTAVAKGALAPLTPTEWAAQALVVLADSEDARGHAVHLVVSPLPRMETVLATASRVVGGARIRGGLPVGLVERLGKIPGLTETARVQADHLASWWTPHRYCLSRNKLDTSIAEKLVYTNLPLPTWRKLENRFFRPI